MSPLPPLSLQYLCHETVPLKHQHYYMNCTEIWKKYLQNVAGACTVQCTMYNVQYDPGTLCDNM